VCIAFDANHFARGTDQASQQESYISYTGTQIEDALSWTNTYFTEEFFGVSESRSVSNPKSG
jgi:hypothetical protein